MKTQHSIKITQVATYKVFASRSPQTPLKKGGFEMFPPFLRGG
jgi:hypothetical protein